MSMKQILEGLIHKCLESAWAPKVEQQHQFASGQASGDHQSVQQPFWNDEDLNGLTAGDMNVAHDSHDGSHWSKSKGMIQEWWMNEIKYFVPPNTAN